MTNEEIILGLDEIADIALKVIEEIQDKSLVSSDVVVESLDIIMHKLFILAMTISKST